FTVTGRVADDRSGVAALQAALDGGSFAAVAFDPSGNFNLTTSLPLDQTADGAHTLHLSATDRAGNVSALADLSFTLGPAAPTVTLTSPAQGLTTDDNVTITGLVADDRSGVAFLGALVDGDPFTYVPFDSSGNFSLTTSLPLDGTADGIHTVH